jgi:hypothetical protein
LRFLKLYCNVVDAWVLCASSINEKRQWCYDMAFRTPNPVHGSHFSVAPNHCV